MPTAPGAEIRDIVRICGEAGVQARIIPGIYELLDGSVSVKQCATCGSRICCAASRCRPTSAR